MTKNKEAWSPPHHPAFKTTQSSLAVILDVIWRILCQALLALLSTSTPETQPVVGTEHKRWQPLFEPPEIRPAVSPNYLAQQPVEMLDRICFFLVGPEDLLAFALTSRANHSVVVPRHLQFRRLRSDARWMNIWETLLAHRGTASRFSSLEICSGSAGNAIAPLSLFTTPEAVKKMTARSWENPALQRLADVAGCLRGLTRFHWTDTSIRITDQVDLLSALRDNCPLEDVLLVNKRILPRQDAFTDEPPSIDPAELKRIKTNIIECPLFDLSDLVRFSFSAPGESIGADYSRMYDMLIKRCPRLEDLQLYNHASKLSAVFAQGRWPRLSRISFKGRSLRPGDREIFSDFCSAHQDTLACIQVDGPLAVDLVRLPKLRSMYIGLDSFHRHVPPEIARNLEHLTLVIDSVSRDYPPLELMPNLRHLMIAGRSLPPACLSVIADAAPNVERLALASSAWMFFKKTDFSTTNGSFNAFLDFLSRFPRLTHYSRLGISTHCETSHCCVFNDIMERIACVSPTLQYINIADNHVGKRRWLEVERYPFDRPGSYAHWDVPKDYKSLRPCEWGGFYPFEVINPGGCAWSGVEPS